MGRNSFGVIGEKMSRYRQTMAEALNQVRESKQKPYVSMSSGGQYNVLDGDTIIGSIAAGPDDYWWSAEQYIGDGWFYVLPEYRNLKDQIPPSHLLIDAVIDYAKEQDKPLILGIFNLEGVERAKKLFDKKGFHQIGGMYYRK